MSKAALEIEAPGPVREKRERGFKLRLLLLIFGFNLAGGVLLGLYFAVIDVSPPAAMRFESRLDMHLMFALPPLFAIFVCWLYSRPVFEWMETVSRSGLPPGSEKNGDGRALLIHRRILRYPFIAAVASLSGWLLMTAVIGARLYWLSRNPPVAEAPLPVLPGSSSALLAEELYQAGASLQQQWNLLTESLKLIGIGSMMGAVISASLFFVMESVWQRGIARFFPAGQISVVGEKWIVPVRLRLMTVFLIVGAVPLIAFGILSYQRAKAMMHLSPEDLLQNLLLFNVFMVLAGVGLAVILAGFVARSVSEPLEKLREAMERVKTGYFWLQVPVRSNDELGRVTEGFNEMVRALGEKEASLAELTQRLEDKVRERTRELSGALEEKQRTQAQLVHAEKMASLGQLVAGVAHEINNPVGYIYANTDHFERFISEIKDGLSRNDRDQLDQSLARMEKLVQSTREGARRAKEIVAGLRTFSRKSPSQRRPVDVHEGLETALMLLGHELKKGVRLVRDFGELPLVVANSGELTQVFINVILNAVQAMAENGELRIQTRKENHQAVIRFQDNGSGIKPEHLTRLFEPFFTTKEVGKGTGLGLAISYGIVKAHGGEIRAESEPGLGTTIEIRLPLPGSEPARGSAEQG